jgi:pseudouridine kinase
MKPQIACIGGVDIDRKARADGKLRLRTSNPVRVKVCPGGVIRNIAYCLARLGCPVSLFSIVGQDAAGEALLKELEGAGVDISAVVRSARNPTASYTAVLEEDGQLLVGLAEMAIFDDLDAAWAESMAPTLAQCAIWVLDTNLPPASLECLLRKQKRNALVLVDPVSVAKSIRLRALLDLVDVLFPDREEAAELSGHPVGTRDDVPEAAEKLRKMGVGRVIVTLGAEGLYFDDGKSRKFMAAIPAKTIRDVTGAGDALVAGYVYGLLLGGDCDPARCGLAAASLALETDKSVPEDLTPERLRQRLDANPHADADNQSLH